MFDERRVGRIGPDERAARRDRGLGLGADSEIARNRVAQDRPNRARRG